MPSLIPGFTYDVFISYRQKDNKGDRWVSEFVDTLKTELESTFKEEISVFFDINPHDGLLETHDVDESLKDKLKCLIFIPIISRTYCDPKSFAWEHEFKTFAELASHDQFGLKLKLPSGNVASRVLPVRIHDLDAADIKECESVLGGYLRGVEFIYKEAGIDKPLAPDDDEKKNLNNTKYRIQIIKVAHAIKEIMTAAKQQGHETNVDVSEEHKVVAVPTNSNKTVKKIAGYAVITAFFIFGIFLIPKLVKPEEQLEKSIAVLPFINDSPDQDNGYFINGLMDEILNNLQRIKEFRVLSRTSTERYRGSNKPAIPKIAKDLDVNYIVEGSGQKYGNKFVLRVQLITGENEKHLWGNSYEQEIKEVSDIIGIQNQVAKAIADELKTTLTPEESQLIEKTPTTSLTAYDFYQRGQYELSRFPFPQFNLEATNRAEALFNKALSYDSTFAMAYGGLASVYLIRWNRDYMILENSTLNAYLDSALLLADIALSIDNQLAEAFYIRGEYYAVRGSTKQVIEEWDKVIRYNPNFSGIYEQKGGLYEELDIAKSLEYLEKAASMDHSSGLTSLLTRIGKDYYTAGFPEMGKKYLLEVLQLDGDSVKFSDNIVFNTAITLGDYKNALNYFEKRFLKDTTNIVILRELGYLNSLVGKSKESLNYYKKYISMAKASRESFPPLNRFTQIGYAYLQNGFGKEAEYYFNNQIQRYKTRLASVRSGERIYWTYPLAAIYACRGDKKRAYENLKIFDQNPGFTLEWVTTLKNDPMFNNIRDEPEFQSIMKDVESKYQAEHERVRKWLAEQGKL